MPSERVADLRPPQWLDGKALKLIALLVIHIKD